MPNESTPPIRELPDEIETAITWLVESKMPYTRLNAAEALRQAIRAALNDQDAALRERCDRLRLIAAALDELEFIPSEIDVPFMYFRQLQPGDLADDLIPRKGDVLP